jgi:hypothetical protein
VKGIYSRERRTSLFIDLDGGLVTADANDLTNKVVVADADLLS